jgi:UBX domain-containing protein 7
MDEDVAQFMAITGTDNERVARGFLEISNNDQMQAIQLFFESPELAVNFTNDNNTASSAGVQSSTHPGRRGYSGREDSRGVITIDSDDDVGDVDMAENDHDESSDVAAVARAAQEEDDAAMARRLQEEMYGQGGAADQVRAPMSRTTETLVAPDPSWNVEDDSELAVLEQLRRRRQPPSKPIHMRVRQSSASMLTT